MSSASGRIPAVLTRTWPSLLGGGWMLLAGIAAAAAQSAPFTGPSGPVFSPPPSIVPQQSRPAPTSREPHQNVPVVAPGKVPLALSARYNQDGPPIARALQWRVFVAGANPVAGAPVLAGEASEPYPVFALAPGEYLVHVAHGLAESTQRIALGNEPKREVLTIAGGGLRMQGRVGEAAIPPQRLRFEVYEGSFLQRSGAGRPASTGGMERPPVVRHAAAGDLVLLPAGSYYIQSTYGDGNAVIQADVRIEPGRLTDATVHHRAAMITLKLVNNRGGEAIANTQWSVLTPGGDSIKESIGAFPSVVLAEGEYIAVARHEGKTFQATFKVQSGLDREIEVLAQ